VADQHGSREADHSTIKARPHGIKPEGESKDTSSIPASLHLPCDVKHALLINSPCPGGTESATLGGRPMPISVRPGVARIGAAPLASETTTTPSTRESQGTSEDREAVPAVGELPGQKH
jgi:hypothetical protein